MKKIDDMLMDERGIKTKTLDSSCVLSEIKQETTTNERGKIMKKIKIKMLESMKGRDDDEIQTKLFVKGESYYMGAELAHVFVKQLKIAENKMVKPDENKTAEESECQDKAPETAKVESKQATAKKKRLYKRTKK